MKEMKDMKELKEKFNYPAPKGHIVKVNSGQTNQSLKDLSDQIKKMIGE